ncbi:TSUP family transporter, partial [bacterium]|nr:TSUP family transporter [bacterium]
QLNPFAWLLIGLGTGLFSGYTGLGGGIFLIPLLAWIAHVPVKNLAGTSSAVVVLTSLAGALGYFASEPITELPPVFAGHIHVVAALCLAVTGVPGAQLGAWWNKRAGSSLYKRIFAVLLFIMVIRLFWTA